MSVYVYMYVPVCRECGEGSPSWVQSTPRRGEVQGQERGQEGHSAPKSDLLLSFLLRMEQISPLGQTPGGRVACGAEEGIG